MRIFFHQRGAFLAGRVLLFVFSLYTQRNSTMGLKEFCRNVEASGAMQNLGCVDRHGYLRIREHSLKCFIGRVKVMDHWWVAVLFK